MAKIVVIGAGVGGLTTAALLVKAGHEVIVLEASTYPGGSAGTFYHQGFRFDAGATLAGGFQPGGPHARIAEILDIEWPVKPIEDAGWVVHLPERTIHQWVDAAQWMDEVQEKFPFSGKFWQLQHHLADAVWDISTRSLPWPPKNIADLWQLASALRFKSLPALPYVFATMADLLPRKHTREFKTFLDAQLLISAQTISDRASALYGSAAIDLPRRGINHVSGGMGGIAETLAAWIKSHGGEVHYRQEVLTVETISGRARAVITKKGLRVECDALVANVTPWGWQKLLALNPPASIQREIKKRKPTWGAFVLYLGLDAARMDTATTHHQVIADVDARLGETNSIFLSLSPLDDPRRAPAGMRAATLSTHTTPESWYNLSEAGYTVRKAEYAEKCLDVAARAFPQIKSALTFSLPGTPRTFETFTRRPMGMVGGFPQESLFAARGPHSGLANAWLVGDSVFPGQSTAGVTLGALRVAADVQAAMRERKTAATFSLMGRTL